MSNAIIGDLRYSFTAQFLRGAAIFTKHSRNIEENFLANPSTESESEHRAYVVAAIIQSSAAIESEISELVEHGPGHHLGSNGLDNRAHDYLKPLAEVIDGQPALDRYQIVLHMLNKQKLDAGQKPFQPAALLIRLRNELVHYKSRWSSQSEKIKLFETLRQLKHKPPPFAVLSSPFFPHKCLSADCAEWSVQTSLAFIDVFYDKLQITSPLEAHRTNIKQILAST